jgi:hypothetical protein
MADRLREDSAIRAKLYGNRRDPYMMMDSEGIEDAVRRFKTHLTKRRQFILDQLDGKIAANPAKKNASTKKSTPKKTTPPKKAAAKKGKVTSS